MTKLTKIYADDCEVCASLGDSAKDLAVENDLEYEEVELMALANQQSSLRDYVVHYHVNDETGMIDLPLYTITTDKGDTQGSSVVKELTEVANLISSWKLWTACQKP